MNKFILKTGVFLLIILVFVIYFGSFKASNPDDYLAILIDKHKISESIKTPKILLVGGSNLAFGINSKVLEQNLGVPVINMGLRAEFGVSFILNEAKSIMKKNDIIVLSFEYFLDLEGEYALKKRVSNIFPKANTFYQKDNLLEIDSYLTNTRENYKFFMYQLQQFGIENIKNILGKNALSKPKPHIYSRKSVNNYGDMVAHLEAIPPQELQPTEVLVYKYWAAISAMNIFYEYAQKQQIKVFFSYPCYSETAYNQSKAQIILLEKDLKNNLKIPILSEPTQFVYPNIYFFDTHYHLTKQGRKQRTEGLSKILNKIMKKGL